MRVLVTGGAGFIGSHLVKKLLAMKCSVTVVDNLCHGLRENVPSDAEFVLLDITSPVLDEIISRGNFACIIHLAAQTRVDVSMAYPEEDGRCNIMGTIHVLECARKYGVRRVVFASSAAVYGNPPAECLPLDENQHVRPLSYYGLSKAAAESYVQLYYRSFGLEYAVLRFANVYGERVNIDDEGGVINVFAHCAAVGKPIVVFGDGSQSRDYIYVGDVVNGIIAAMKAAGTHGVYNLSTERETSLQEAVHVLERISGTAIVPVYQPPRCGDIARSVLSSRKAVQELGWRPYVSLEEGMARLYDYFRLIDHKQGDAK